MESMDDLPARAEAPAHADHRFGEQREPLACRFEIACRLELTGRFPDRVQLLHPRHMGRALEQDHVHVAERLAEILRSVLRILERIEAQRRLDAEVGGKDRIELAPKGVRNFEASCIGLRRVRAA